MGALALMDQFIDHRTGAALEIMRHAVYVMFEEEIAKIDAKPTASGG
jgi:hypothetical protein